MENKQFLVAIATLVGTIIGAGVLGLPYVVAKAGFWTGAVVIVLLGFAILTINLYVGEISLRTKAKHQLVGFAAKYLGKTGKRIMTFSIIFGIYGALVAYIIGEGAVLSAIFGGSQLIYSLIFFAIMTLIIYIGLKAVEEWELWLSAIMLGVVLIICAFSFGWINLNNLTAFSLSRIFVPYGVILFAFIGAAAVPALEEELIKNRKQLKKAIIIGSLIPIIAYLLFALVVVGVTGLGTTEVATIGLGEKIGMSMVLFGNLFAVFSMATSFLALGLALKWVFCYDYRIGKVKAVALTCLIPLAIALSGLTTFIRAIGITGAIAGGIDGILIVLMF